MRISRHSVAVTGLLLGAIFLWSSAVVAADLLLEPQAAVERTIATAATASGSLEGLSIRTSTPVRCCGGVIRTG